MAISTAVSRIADFCGRHGFIATLRRAGVGVKRALFSSRSILFYCELPTLTAPPPDLPGGVEVERKKSTAELSPENFEAITSFWSPKLAQRNMKERFAKGASLWLIKSNSRLAGYGWTLAGRTVEPHYFPLGTGDVHLFDFHVFPQYRGQGMNPLLVCHILSRVACEAASRAFIEAAEWNQPQLSSLSKTPFRCLGQARKLTICGHTVVFWAEKNAVPTSTKVPVRAIDNPARGL
jgi:ribosomal protein S18 acetylase RimI-like enzyme